MEELFLSDDHKKKFMHLMLTELGFEGFKDAYWRTLCYIISGSDSLYAARDILIDYDELEIRPEIWFGSTFSGGEKRLLALAFNLFTDNDYYESDETGRYNISPLEVFSGLDDESYKLAINAITVRLHLKVKPSNSRENVRL